MRFDYKSEVVAFNEDLEEYNATLINEKDDKIGVCKKILSSPLEKYRPRKFSNLKMGEFFMSFINDLNSSVKDYYIDALQKIKLVRDNSVKNGEAYLIGNNESLAVFMTAKPFMDTDFIAYSHEYGHVPTFFNPSRDEYFEYLEVLPMYFEFLACKKLNNDNPKELFVHNRIGDLKTMARGFIRDNKEIKNNGSYKDKFFENEKAEAYKYFKSMDYTLQLIDNYMEDEKAVNFLIARNINGEKSFKNIAGLLDVDTRGCKRLLKELRN